MPIMRTAGNPKRKTLRRDLFVALLCGAFVVLMGGLSRAAMPLYSWFCRANGFGGTTELAGAQPRQQSPRLVTVRFASDLAAGLPLRPPRNTVDARLGHMVAVSYRAANEARRIGVGEAGYSVNSPTVGLYFEKINCFCVAPRITRSGEGRDMTVVLCVDRRLVDDSDQDGVSAITLFYTFYPARARPPASGPAQLPGRV
jgi:cytochrome c oxidase assembly protein subunit 11